MSDEINLAQLITERFKANKTHKIPLEELEKLLATNTKTGLTSEAVRERLTYQGPNVSTQGKVGLIFGLRQLKSAFSLAVWSLCALYVIPSCVWGETRYLKTTFTASTFLILAVALFATLRARRQVAKQEATAAAVPVTVIRDGAEIQVGAGGLVVGDIVRIKAGEAIPADLRIL
jgi:magnesium-transporting ATPase (P-type)